MARGCAGPARSVPVQFLSATLNVAAERTNETIVSHFPSPAAEKRALKTNVTVHGVQLRSFYRRQCRQSNKNKYGETGSP
jgi:hypothetical protein